MGQAILIFLLLTAAVCVVPFGWWLGHFSYWKGLTKYNRNNYMRR